MPAILYGNMKGGVGKTTNSVMTAYQLAKLGYKTLVCDLDPQANATQLLRRTYGLQHETDLQIGKTMMVALTEENIKPAIVNIMDNLYLLPSSEDFKNYPDFLEMKFMLDKEKIESGDSTTLQSEMSKVKEQRIAYFAQQLAKVRDEYDFVIIDVPPTLSIFTDSAIYATDFVIIVLQTQQRSLDGAETFFEYLQQHSFGLLSFSHLFLSIGCVCSFRVPEEKSKILPRSFLSKLHLAHAILYKIFEMTFEFRGFNSASDFSSLP